MELARRILINPNGAWCLLPSTASAITRLRVAQCTVDADLAHRRVRQRARVNPVRRAHADPRGLHPAGPFVRFRPDAPCLEVDTTDGYRPGLAQIVAFVNGPD